jgi:hypothetical protein
MFLKFGSRLAEVPDFAPEELERTISKVERKKQKLEDDIKRYIREKQDELTKYELELVEQKRPMNGTSSTLGEDVNAMDYTPSSASLQESVSPKSERSSSPESEEAAKRKLSRVHKREKELRGLVTPVFLPLLEARDLSPKKKRSRSKQKEGKLESGGETAEQTSLSRDKGIGGEQPDDLARGTGGDDIFEIEDGTGEPLLKDTQKLEKEREKKRRPSIKKSSLRQKGTPKERRKRVSLVIDDQIVHPSDNIGEYVVTSPHSETSASAASASNSALDLALDPRLLHFPHTVLDPVHHSLPLPVIVHTDSDSAQNLSASPPPLDYEPPQSAARAILDPSPPIIPGELPHSAPDPIYATSPMNIDEPEIEDQGAMPSSSYVGGLSGSGVDDVDQAGSYGYPSSLGASYMESYMKSRPLSVRIAAAEKAGLAEAEKRELLRENEGNDNDLTVERIENVEDESMGIMGDMEGF